MESNSSLLNSKVLPRGCVKKYEDIFILDSARLNISWRFSSPSSSWNKIRMRHGKHGHGWSPSAAFRACLDAWKRKELIYAHCQWSLATFFRGCPKSGSSKWRSFPRLVTKQFSVMPLLKASISTRSERFCFASNKRYHHYRLEDSASAFSLASKFPFHSRGKSQI